MSVRRRQTRLSIGIRVSYEKVIPYKPSYQSSLVRYLNRFLYFDVKYFYNYYVIRHILPSMSTITMRSQNSSTIMPNPEVVRGRYPDSMPMGCNATGRMTQKNGFSKAAGLPANPFFSLCCPEYYTPFRTFSLVAEGNWGIKKSC